MKTVTVAKDIVKKFAEEKNILKFVEDVCSWSSYFGWISFQARQKFERSLCTELCKRRIDVKISLALADVDEDAPVML